MKRSLPLLAAMALLAAAPAAAQGTIRAGMTTAEVRAAFGAPAAVREAGSWTYLFYRNGCPNRCGSDDVVFIEDGRVVAAVLRTRSRRFAGPEAARALASASADDVAEAGVVRGGAPVRTLELVGDEEGVTVTEDGRAVSTVRVSGVRATTAAEPDAAPSGGSRPFVPQSRPTSGSIIVNPSAGGDAPAGGAPTRVIRPGANAPAAGGALGATNGATNTGATGTAEPRTNSTGTAREAGHTPRTGRGAPTTSPPTAPPVRKPNPVPSASDSVLNRPTAPSNPPGRPD